MKHTLSTVLIGGLALLASCTSDEPIPKQTQAWLHDTDGMVLTFKNTATGAAEPVEVHIRNESQRVGSGRFTIRHTRVHQTFLYYQINPQPTPPLYGLEFEFADEQVAVSPNPSYWADSRIFLQTSSDTNQETVTAEPEAEGALYDKITLGYQTYGRGLIGKFLLTKRPQPADPQNLEKFYYTKDQGLIAYRKADGQLWVRVQ